MLYEKIEAAKSLSLAAYQDLLIELFEEKQTKSCDDLVCLFIVSAIYKDKESFIKLKFMIENCSDFESPELKFYYYMGIGQFNYHIFNYSETLSAHLKLLEIAYSIDDHFLIAEGNRLMGLIYRKLGDFEQSKYFIEKSIRTLKSIKMPLVKARVYMSYGAILMEMRSFEHSKSAYETSLGYFERLHNYNDLINYRILLLNLYELCDILGDYSGAVKYYLKMQNTKVDADNVMLNEKFLYANSQVLKKQGKHVEALEILEQLYDKQRIVRVPGRSNKNDIQFHIDQIDILKSRNDTLIKRLNEMYEIITPIEPVQSHFKLEERLNEALENGEIRPYFQLVWDVNKKTYSGAEALIRWVKEDIVVPPGQFIPDVEDSSIIIKLSEKVIRDAFELCREAIDLGYEDFTVSLNIAPYQLYNHEIADFIKSEMMVHNIKSKNVEVEITERSFLEKNPKILEELYKLKDLGIKIALDDFGKGYSSLACINEFPISVIKVDRSLITNIAVDEKSFKLLSSIISMVKALDLEVVAEGVESIEQVEILEMLNCDIIQGYYYDRPSPCCDMLKKLNNTQSTNDAL